LKLGQWLGFLCLAISLLILWQVRQMLLLVFAAVILATAFNGLVHRFQKAGLRRHVAVPITLGSVVLLTLVFVGLIVPPFINQFLELLRLLPDAFTQILTQLEGLIAVRPEWLNFEVPDTSELARQLQPLLQNLLRNFFAFFSNSLTALVQFLLVMVLTVMLLTNPSAYREALLLLFPSFYRRRADEIFTQCEVQLGNWMGGLFISSSFVAGMSFTGLSILQVNLVLAHALLAGLLNFIPNIGPTISVVFPLIVALQDAPWKAIAVIILYIVIQQVESYWVTPAVMAQQVSLLPAFTLIAQIFFASFFGFLGLLLALPLAVVAKTWIEEALVKDILNPWNNGRLDEGSRGDRRDKVDRGDGEDGEDGEIVP
jgi:predicted PurR-regulated permease PerM